MELTLAKRCHLAEIMKLMRQAKAFLKESHIDQWQNAYPDAHCIEEDIEAKTGYLCLHETKIIGYVCIDFRGEPAYENLKSGAWRSLQPYAVLHRLALEKNVRGQGAASQVFSLAETMCREKNIHSIKVDTDGENKIMKHLLQKNGFHARGVIYFDNSEKIAYEKLL